MYRNAFIAGLTLVSILFGTAYSTRAELAADTIQNIEPTRTPNNRRASSASDRSMRYTRMGFEAQKRGDETKALGYYTKAVEIDPTNAYAFMAAGNLLGDTKEGIICMKAAAVLFKQQENQEGYDAAIGWLQEKGISEDELQS
jgi:tetratricopeptide (TPR) repeat protein